MNRRDAEKLQAQTFGYPLCQLVAENTLTIDRVAVNKPAWAHLLRQWHKRNAPRIRQARQEWGVR